MRLDFAGWSHEGRKGAPRPPYRQGYRGAGGGVNLYDLIDGEWKRSVLDPKMPTAACAVADFNNDGRPDLACIGATSLKWYENLGGPSSPSPRQ